MPFGLVKVKSISGLLPLCGDARIPAPFADQSLLTCPGRSDTGIGASATSCRISRRGQPGPHVQRRVFRIIANERGIGCAPACSSKDSIACSVEPVLITSSTIRTFAPLTRWISFSSRISVCSFCVVMELDVERMALPI